MEELTPQQIEFLKGYLDPKSETFGNAYRSALNAKYSKEYAEVITTKDLKWLSENVGDITMLQKAERNLNKALDIDIDNEKIGDRGLKATMFIAERLGKSKYSQKTEVENSGNMTVNIVNYANNNPVQVPTEDIPGSTS